MQEHTDHTVEELPYCPQWLIQLVMGFQGLKARILGGKNSTSGSLSGAERSVKNNLGPVRSLSHEL